MEALSRTGTRDVTVAARYARLALQICASQAGDARAPKSHSSSTLNALKRVSDQLPKLGMYYLDLNKQDNDVTQAFCALDCLFQFYVWSFLHLYFPSLVEITIKMHCEEVARWSETP